MDRIGDALSILDANKEMFGPLDERLRDYRRARNHRITLQQFEAMLEAQRGCCYICGKHFRRTRLHIDHCHATGRIRKLLCQLCNTSLGWVENGRQGPRWRTMHLRAKMLSYIEEHA